MGVVYRARQISLNRIVAIKMILGGHLANAAEVQRFRAEAETAAQLQHPEHRRHSRSRRTRGPAILLDGFRRGPEPGAAGAGRAAAVAQGGARYLKTIAEAMHYAHSRGVLHRDLKPSNILIDEKDQPRITDFGLAKRLTTLNSQPDDSQLTQTGQVLGSPSFMPPEQAAGQEGQRSAQPATSIRWARSCITA